MNEGPLWPGTQMGERYKGYLTTVSGADIHFNGEFVCLTWGNGDDEWDGWTAAHWVEDGGDSFKTGMYCPPEDTHEELLRFIIPYCQLHT